MGSLPSRRGLQAIASFACIIINQSPTIRGAHTFDKTGEYREWQHWQVVLCWTVLNWWGFRWRESWTQSALSYRLLWPPGRRLPRRYRPVSNYRGLQSVCSSNVGYHATFHLQGCIMHFWGTSVCLFVPFSFMSAEEKLSKINFAGNIPCCMYDGIISDRKVNRKGVTSSDSILH